VSTDTLSASSSGTLRTETAVRLVDVHKTYDGATPVAACAACPWTSPAVR
jgi:hypothetical protein